MPQEVTKAEKGEKSRNWVFTLNNSTWVFTLTECDIKRLASPCEHGDGDAGEVHRVRQTSRNECNASFTGLHMLLGTTAYVLFHKVNSEGEGFA